MKKFNDTNVGLFVLLTTCLSLFSCNNDNDNFPKDYVGFELSLIHIFLWEKDGVTQQELCNATFKDKPSMTRLIDNMERQHLVVRISDKKDRRTNLIHLTKDGKELEEKARIIAGQTLKEALHGITLEELSIGQEVLKKVFYNTKD